LLNHFTIKLLEKEKIAHLWKRSGGTESGKANRSPRSTRPKKLREKRGRKMGGKKISDDTSPRKKRKEDKRNKVSGKRKKEHRSEGLGQI